MFSELRGHWEAIDRNPIDHVFVRKERHLKDRYRQKVDKLMDAVHMCCNAVSAVSGDRVPIA